MKKVAGNLRIDLAQYRELEVFTQFSSDLDDGTKATLNYGSHLIELLKQRFQSVEIVRGGAVAIESIATSCR